MARKLTGADIERQLAREIRDALLGLVKDRNAIAEQLNIVLARLDRIEKNLKEVHDRVVPRVPVIPT